MMAVAGMKGTFEPPFRAGAGIVRTEFPTIFNVFALKDVGAWKGDVRRFSDKFIDGF